MRFLVRVRRVASQGLAALRRSAPSPKRQRCFAALRVLLLAACALLLVAKTTTTLARALARAFAPSAHLASSAKTRGPRRLFSPPTAAMAPMKVLAVRTAKRTYPTGDPSFAVQQAFPAGAFAGAPLHASASGWAPGSAASRNARRRLLTP